MRSTNQVSISFIKLAFFIVIFFPAISNAQIFTDINANITPVSSGTVAWADYDNDGDLDFVLTGKQSSRNRITRIYQNNDGIFTDINANLIAISNGSVAWGDFDNDNDLDILMMGSSGIAISVAIIYRNDSKGVFSDIRAELEIDYSFGTVSWGDIDNDGDLDALVGAKTYRNNGDETFTQLNVLSAYHYPQFGDYDNDGDLDVFTVAKSPFEPHWDDVVIYENERNFLFKPIYPRLTANFNANVVTLTGFSSKWADFNGDGLLDIVICGNADAWFTRLFSNFGKDVFTKTERDYLDYLSRAISWGDYDNDGLLDFVQLGTNYQSGGANVKTQTRLFHNNGNGDFAEIETILANLNGGSPVWGDYDNDGALDLFIVGERVEQIVTKVAKIYKNNSLKRNTSPSAPLGLTSLVAGDSVTLMWQPAADTETPSAGLTYNLRVGTTPGGVEIISPMSDIATGKRLLPSSGNVYHNTRWDIKYLKNGTYFWSVQAVDNAFASSPFSEEQQFVVNAPMNNAPKIISVPDTISTVGLEYSYQVQAEDLDQDNLIFTLKSTPPFLIIDNLTGLISGKPADNQQGKPLVQVQVDDSKGGVHIQSYNLAVEPYRLTFPLISLSTGNKYIYSGSFHHHGGINFKWEFYEEIISDTVMNNVRYAVVKSTDKFSELYTTKWFSNPDEPFFYYKRADSSKIYIYDPRSDNEIVVMDFNATLQSENPVFGYVFGKDVVKIFDEEQFQISTSQLLGSFYFLRSYATIYGLTGYALSSGPGGGSSPLRGAVIDGVVYGDTILTGIVEIFEPEIPSTFALSQNFPNPFNASTTIVFEIPERAFVTLTIYDLNGRQVATLLNGDKPQGHYEIHYQTNNLPSGIYYYNIKAGTYSAVKKMVLIR